MAYFSTATAPERRNVTEKDRVWDFFRLSSETHPASRRQPAQPRRKIRPTATKSASGIPYWPSRDPIGEMGGLNLYGFVGNDGVNQWDILGKTPISQVTISAITVGQVKLGNCGSFKWIIYWSVEPKSDAKKGGQVMQSLTYTEDIQDCSGKAKEGYPKKTIYSEVWKVLPDTTTVDGFAYTNKFTSDNANQDEFGGGSRGRCSKGEITVTGLARYYPSQTDPIGWGTGNTGNGTFSKDLLSNLTNPGWGTSGASNGLKHEIVIEWNCCHKLWPWRKSEEVSRTPK